MATVTHSMEIKSSYANFQEPHALWNTLNNIIKGQRRQLQPNIVNFVNTYSLTFVEGKANGCRYEQFIGLVFFQSKENLGSESLAFLAHNSNLSRDIITYNVYTKSIKPMCLENKILPQLNISNVSFSRGSNLSSAMLLKTSCFYTSRRTESLIKGNKVLNVLNESLCS